MDTDPLSREKWWVGEVRTWPHQQMGDILSGPPGGTPKNLSDWDLLERLEIQHDLHILQRPLPTLPQNSKRGSGRSVGPVMPRDGGGQCASSVFGRVDRVHGGARVGILDDCVEDIVFLVESEG